MCAFLEDCFPIILGSILSILGGCFTTLWSSKRERKERLWESKRQEYNNAIRIVRIIRESLEKIRVGAAGNDGSDEECDKETLQGFENAYSAINSNLYETLLKLKMLGNDAIVCEFDKLGKIVMDYFQKMSGRFAVGDYRFIGKEYNEMLGCFDGQVECVLCAIRNENCE